MVAVRKLVITSDNENDDLDDSENQPEFEPSSVEKEQSEPSDDENPDKKLQSSKTTYEYYLGEVSFLTERVAENNLMSIDLLRAILERDTEYVQVDVSSSKDPDFDHASHDEPFTQVRGPRRRQLRELTKYRSSYSIYQENCKKYADEKQTTGYTDKEFKLQTIQKINSERKVLNRQKLRSLDIQDFVQQ
ncbi:hypothetical protein KQX54_007591 [Cotesia glomerata]|uniref:Uncharacterized protein n=1 Tax=Cotesia glomerata TaxID=32391 RepID=A0AAV7IKK7_COTGL|nr:hypothetical protein KQX54_007591 [Cotesia glomerata]